MLVQEGDEGVDVRAAGATPHDGVRRDHRQLLQRRKRGLTGKKGRKIKSLIIIDIYIERQEKKFSDHPKDLHETF